MLVVVESKKKYITLKIAMVTALTLKIYPKGSFGRSNKIYNGLILREWGQQLTLTFFSFGSTFLLLLQKQKKMRL